MHQLLQQHTPSSNMNKHQGLIKPQNSNINAATDQPSAACKA